MQADHCVLSCAAKITSVINRFSNPQQQIMASIKSSVPKSTNETEAAHYSHRALRGLKLNEEMINDRIKCCTLTKTDELREGKSN